jgi:hypothetical protein
LEDYKFIKYANIMIGHYHLNFTEGILNTNTWQFSGNKTPRRQNAAIFRRKMLAIVESVPTLSEQCD